MFKKLQVLLIEHLSKNRNTYIFLLMSFVIGVSAGAFTVNGLSSMQRDDLSNYFQGFLQLLDNQNLNSAELFSVALLENLKLIGILWVLGVTIIGIPFIYIILGVKGFITGFSSAYIIQALGAKGILFTIFALLPKEIIIVPCLIAIGVNGIKFSMQIARNRSDQDKLKSSIKASFVSYCLFTAFFSCIILAGVIIDAYVTPVLVRIISPVLTI